MSSNNNLYAYGLPFRIIVIFTVCSVIGLQTVVSYAQTEQPVFQSDSTQNDFEGLSENTLTMIEINLKAGLGTVIRPHVTGDDRVIVLRQQNIPGGTEGSFFMQRLKYLHTPLQCYYYEEE